MTTQLINKIKEINEEKYAFKSEGYKMQLNKWAHLDRLMIIDNYFDGMPLEQITKLKVKGEKGEGKTYVLKITINQTDHYYSFKRDVQQQWFKHIIWGKLYSLINLNPNNEQFINLCEGTVLKKSNIKKVWNKRFVSITKIGGLISCKQKNDAPNLQVDYIKELWTRFELIQKKMYFVFKIHHNFSKYEFGVPVEMVLKWAQAFFSLIKFQQ